MSLSNLAFGDSTKKNVDTLNKLINTTNVTGENLLINPNFKLNSWGETTYKAEKTGRIFSVDSWLFVVNKAGSMLDVTDNGIRITNASDTSTACIVQEISSENILGNKITISVKLGSFTTPESGDVPGFIDFHKKEGVESSGISSYFTGAQQNEVFTVSFDIPSDADIRYIYFGACLGCTIEIEWVKMELGEFSTNFIEPDPRNELEKVNQYYYHNPLRGNETKNIVLKDILTNPKYPYPYNVRINSSTAPEGDTSGLYIPDIGLHGTTTDDIWWDIHYYPDTINKTNSTSIAYSGEGVRVKNGDGEWASVDNARSSDVSYFQQEHILTDGKDILSYVASDECPIGRNTKVRIWGSPTCPTNYGHSATDNDFFYDIYKLRNGWAIVKAYDIKGSGEFLNSFVNGNWNGWMRCNDHGNAQSLRGFTVSNSGLDLMGNPTASGSKPVLGVFDDTNGSHAFYDIRLSNGDSGRIQIDAHNVADVLVKVYKYTAETDKWTEGLVDRASRANLSYHQYEHFLTNRTDVLAYITSDYCPANVNTIVRIMHSPTCPTNYGYSASENDFFYHIFKLDNSWATVKAYDIRGNVEFMNSCLNGTWSGWIRCNGVGKNTAGRTYTYNGTSYTGSINCEVFNDGCSAGGNYCHAEGKNTAAYGHASHAEGRNTTAVGSGAHAEGHSTTASKDQAHAEGYSTTASGSQSHAEGSCTTASGEQGHAEGYKTTASGNTSHAEGSNSDSSGTALSDRTVTVGSTSITVIGSQSYGINSHAEGTQTLAYGYTSHAEGYQTTASGYGAHAEGYNTTASGTCAHAEGYDTHAAGYSHAEGYGTTASSSQSHAEGYNTTASSGCAHAEGYNTTASGGQSHAEGNRTTASRICAHAEGYGTTASSWASHAGGKHNKAMTECIAETLTTGDVFVIGNGTSSSALSNAFRVTYAGAVYGLSAFNSSGADYAEFIKPWFDNNPDNEDRVGYFVTIKDGLLYKANEGDYITGITSGNPSVVGNADEDYYWRYERDEFNRFVYEDVEEEIEKLDDDGNPILDDDGHPVMIKTGNIIKNGRLKLSEDYDPSKQNSYVERKDRPEWSYVGMIGVLPVRDDGTCEVGRFCKCGKDGIATLATERGFDTFFVVERISDNIVSVELR